MGDWVEGSREVKEDEDTDVAGVSSTEHISNFDEGCLWDVVGLEPGLKGFIELMVGQVLVELGNCSFYSALRVADICTDECNGFTVSDLSYVHIWF